jgi:hypothetical protein
MTTPGGDFGLRRRGRSMTSPSSLLLLIVLWCCGWSSSSAIDASGTTKSIVFILYLMK